MNGLRKKLNDVQAIVTVLAVLLMMPPIILIFNGAGLIGDIPVVVVFIFGTWLALILVTWYLGRFIDAPESGENSPASSLEPPAIDPTR